MAEKDLQEKVMAYRMLEARLEALLKQRDTIVSRIMELQSTVASIDEIEKSKDVLFPVGLDAYTLGKIVDKKNILISIGAGIVLEKNIPEAKETLSKRKQEMEQALNELQNSINSISAGLEQLGPEIQLQIDSQAGQAE